MADIAANASTKAVLSASLDSFSGELEFAGDHDWIRVDLFAGVAYNFYLCFLNTGSISEGDSVLRLRASDGTQLAVDDDSGVGTNSALTFTPGASGTYFLDVGEFGDNNTGEYSLFVSDLSAIVDQLTDGHDEITIAFLQHRVLGGKGADKITLGDDPCDALGEQGNDLIIGRDTSDRISGGLGNDTIEGGAGGDFLFGDAGNDDISGGSGGDLLFGGKGDDILDGGTGPDGLIGGAGKDFLTGGADADFFKFTSITDSLKGARADVILDFEPTIDHIALQDIDAKKGGGDNQFKWIGKAHFHHKKGELHYVKKDGYVLVEGDVTGNGKADFQIKVDGVGKLSADDFLL